MRGKVADLTYVHVSLGNGALPLIPCGSITVLIKNAKKRMFIMRTSGASGSYLIGFIYTVLTTSRCVVGIQFLPRDAMLARCMLWPGVRPWTSI